MLAVLPVRVASNICTVVLQTDNMLYKKDESIETESRGTTRTKRGPGEVPKVAFQVARLKRRIVNDNAVY